MACGVAITGCAVSDAGTAASVLVGRSGAFVGSGVYVGDGIIVDVGVSVAAGALGAADAEVGSGDLVGLRLKLLNSHATLIKVAINTRHMAANRHFTDRPSWRTALSFPITGQLCDSAHIVLQDHQHRKRTRLAENWLKANLRGRHTSTPS